MLSSKHLARVVSKMLRMILQRCSPLEKLDHLGYAALPEFEIIEGALIANEIAHLGNSVFLICQRSILRAYPLFSRISDRVAWHYSSETTNECMSCVITFNRVIRTLSPPSSEEGSGEVSQEMCKVDLDLPSCNLR